MTAMGNNPNLEAVLRYAYRGWKVFPLHSIVNGNCTCNKADCKSPGKHPIEKGGFHNATDNADIIKRWFGNSRDFNIGIRTGVESGIDVLDIDGDAGWKSLLGIVEAYGDLPETVYQKTGRANGYHVFFRHQDGVRNSAGRLGKCLDVRGDGGYIVAAPSVHASGRLYEFFDGQIADWPDFLLSRLTSTQKTKPALPIQKSTTPGAKKTILKNTRNDTFASLAGSMRYKGFSPAAIEAALLAERVERCEDPDSFPESEVAEVVKSISRYPAGKENTNFNLTDSGNGERFAAQFGNTTRYDHTSKSYLHYDGKIWDRETGNQMAREKAVKVARNIIKEADTVDQDKRTAILKHAIASESAGRIASMLQMAQVVRPLPTYTRLHDPDLMLFCCNNVIIDLETGKAYPHDPAKMMTRISTADYMPDSKSDADDVWENFLRFVTEGDAEYQGFLQRLVGYCLTGLCTEEVFMLIHGDRATGKSSFTEAIRTMMGTYATVADFNIFLKRTDTGPRNDIARLHGQRAVISSEVEDGKHLAEGLLKNLTGNEAVSARFLYQEAFEFIPTFKLWLSCNDAPRISDSDSAMWRRVLRLPFNNKLSAKERDPLVKAKLKSKPVSSAILSWAVRGCLEWQKNGLCIPSKITASTEDYRRENNPLKDFLDRLEFTPELTVSVADLRTEYDRFCHEVGQRYSVGPKEFNKHIEALGGHRESVWRCGRNQKCWRGVGIKSSFLRQKCGI